LDTESDVRSGLCLVGCEDRCGHSGSEVEDDGVARDSSDGYAESGLMTHVLVPPTSTPIRKRRLDMVSHCVRAGMNAVI